MAEFVVLGSGCLAPELKDKSSCSRNPAGYALNLSHEILLFDFGFGNFRRLFQAGLDPRDVSHVFLTHRHPDHIGDLPALLFYLREAGSRHSELRIIGPRGFRSFMDRLSRAHHPWMRPRGFKIVVGEREDGEPVRSRTWAVRCREVPHSTESLAYRFESSRAHVCYSGDTGFYPGLAAFAKGVDLFVLDCTLGDSERYEHHLQVSQAIRIFQASEAKKGLFTHLSSRSARELPRKLKGINAAAAVDLMRIKL